MKKSIIGALSIFVSGLGIGWFMGLSTTTIASVVVSSVITLIISLISILSGINEGKLQIFKDVEPVWIAFFIIGLSIGAPIGIHVRSNDLLGINIEKFAYRWRGTELSPKEIQLRLFDSLYPEKGLSESQSKQISSNLYSYNLSEDACYSLKYNSGALLRAKLLALNDSVINEAVAKCDMDTTNCLEVIKTFVCQDQG